MKQLTNDLKRCLLLGIFSLFGLFCSFAAIAHESGPVHHVADTRRMEQEVVNAVNAYRHQRGLPALKMVPMISDEARVHSQDMANKSIPFGHDGFFSRIKHLEGRIKYYNGGSENVAWFPPSKSPRDVVNLWLTSSGHRRNIVGHYDLTGVGIVRDKRGWLYYTQIFIVTKKTTAPMHHQRNYYFGTK